MLLTRVMVRTIARAAPRAARLRIGAQGKDMFLTLRQRSTA